MANLTADESVARVKQLLQIFGDVDAFRNGFTDDADLTPTPILQGVNEFLLLLQPTGVRVGDTTINTVSGTAAYALSQEVGEIFSVRYGNTVLRPTTRRNRDDTKPAWYGTAAGTPSHYIREGNSITLWPKPNAVTVLTITSTLPIPVMTAHSGANGTILYVPESHQRFVPYGAAVILANIDAENKTHLLRRDEYRRFALWLLVDLYRISMPQDFAKTPSLDHFMLPPQFGMEKEWGNYVTGLDAYAPIGAPSHSTSPIGGQGNG